MNNFNWNSFYGYIVGAFLVLATAQPLMVQAKAIDPIGITPISPPSEPVPDKPSSVTAPSSDADGSFKVNWYLSSSRSNNLGAIFFLQQKFNSGSYVTIYQGGSKSKTTSGLAKGTYRFRVKACNDNLDCSGYGYSGDVVVGIAPPPPPPPPPPSVTPPTIPSHDPGAATLAGQFRVDESGQANYSINIATVAGRGGVAPQVSLSYSSQGGNGLVGVGWSISGQSAITRCRRTWEQDSINAAVDLSANDKFCLNGQRLMRISGTYGAHGSKYKTEIDSQVEVTAYSGSTGNPAYFRVTAKDGSISEYGYTADSKLMSNAAGQTNKITTWAQNKFTDNVTLGNKYTYHYETNNSTQEFLLKTINYTGVSNNSIEFIYGSRPDKSTGWSATGSKFTSNNRLTRIDSFSGSNIIRSYKLTYELNTFSLLKTLQECVNSTCTRATVFTWEKIQKGFKTNSTSATPYRGFDSDTKVQPIDINGDGLQDIAYNSDHKIMVGISQGDRFNYVVGKSQDVEYEGFWEQLDYNGDGKTDLMYIRRWGGSYYWTISLSTGSSFSGSNIKIDIKVHNGEEAERMRVMDVNGDAMPDLVYQKSSYYGSFYVRYMELDTSGNRSFGAETPLTFNAPATGLGAANGLSVRDIKLKDAQIVDFNGDGIVDVFAKAKLYKYEYIGGCYGGQGWVFKEERWVLFAGENYQQGNNTAIRYNPFYVMSNAYNMPTKAHHYKILDINGDGLADIMYRRTDAKWQLLLNQGQGKFGGLNTWSPATPIYIGAITYDDHIQFGDYNHDGKTDLIFIDSDRTSIKVREWNGVGFGSARSMGLNSRSRANERRVFLDANGDGVSDYFSLYGKAPRLYLSKTTLKKNHTITRIDNGLGSKTNITYRPLTDSNVYAKGIDANMMEFGKGSPVFDVISPMYVVENAKSTSPGLTSAKASSFDANATATVRYRYRGARMQSGGRGFLGFEALATLDPQTGVETTTTYKQQFPYTGRPHATIRRLVGSNAWPSPSGAASGSSSGVLPPACDDHLLSSCVMDDDYIDQLLPKLNSSGTKQSSTTTQKTTDSSDGESIELSRAVNDWLEKDLGNGVKFPYLQKSTETSYVLNQNLPASIPSYYSGYSKTKASTVTTNNSYDNYANPTLIDVITKDQYGTQVQRKITRNTYGTSTTYKRFGRLTQALVDTYTTSGSSYQRRTSQFQYQSGSLLLNKEIIEPNGDVTKKLTTVYRRDGYGNILQKTTCSSDVSSCGTNTTQHTLSSSYPNWINRWAKTTYHNGTYPVNTSNALNQVAQKVISRNHLGQVLITENIYGTRTHNEYDVFGTLIHSYSDTGAEQWTGRRLSSGDYGIRFKQTTATLGAPTKIQYTDVLGRAVRAGVQGFDGQYIYKDTVTDTQGRTKLSSQPYKESVYAAYWSRSDFDVLGRIVKTTQPDGFRNEMTHSGLTLISKIGIGDSQVNYGNGLIKKETKNALGQLKQIEDAIGGTIDYSYDRYGKLRYLYSKNSAKNNTITTQIQYDSMGRKSKTIDPDMGTWSYTYNALGELTSQTDSLGQKTQTYYDPLGRMVRRIDRNSSGTLVGDSRWTFNSAKGHLSKINNTKDGTYLEEFYYDQFGRNDLKHTKVNGKLHEQQTVFDTAGRVLSSSSNVASLQGLPIAVNEYNSYGYLRRIKNAADSNVIIWEAVGTDNYGNVVTSRSENGRYLSTKSFNPKTGLVEGHTTKQIFGAIYQQLTYRWDTLGNLRKRSDLLTGKNETFSYDSLNRLTQAAVNGKAPKTYAYDDFGNLVTKEGKSHTYGSTTNAGPHALSKVGSTSYYYDKKGNQTSGGGRNITYATFGKPTQIIKGSAKLKFNYGPSRSRYKKLTYDGSNLKETKVTAGGVEIIYTTSNNKTEVRSYIASAILKNVYVGTSTTPTKSRVYLYKDHLGSTDIILKRNGIGDTVTRMSFTSFGERSYYSGWNVTLALTEANLGPLLAETDKGYTGHEQLDNVGLIHMNGRVYDPKLGRFMSADPHIQAPTDTQSLNRYSYVLNNPLSATDPSGYFFKKLKKYWRTIAAIVISIYLPGVGIIADLGAVGAGAVTGFVAGGVATGSLRGALVGAFTGALFGQIGDSFGGHGVDAVVTTEKVLAHGFAGGLSSVLNGGKFGHGFASAGMTAGLGDSIFTKGAKGWDRVKNAVKAAIVGGTMSAVTGGKFQNGAVTGAFSRLLNDDGFGDPDFEEFENATEGAIDIYNPQTGIGFEVDARTGEVLEHGPSYTISGKSGPQVTVDSNGIESIGIGVSGGKKGLVKVAAAAVVTRELDLAARGSVEHSTLGVQLEVRVKPGTVIENSKKAGRNVIRATEVRLYRAPETKKIHQDTWFNRWLKGKN